MPNMCLNKLKIIGEKEAVLDVIEKINNKGFYSVIEPDEETKNDSEKLFYFHKENFNVKWNIDRKDFSLLETGYDDEKNFTILIMFYTPYYPPTGFYEKLIKKFKVNIKACYSEPGEVMCGYFESDDEYLHHEEYNDPIYCGFEENEEYSDTLSDKLLEENFYLKDDEYDQIYKE